MAKQGEGVVFTAGALAATVGVVSFGALIVVGDFAISPAVFLALIAAVVVAVFLLIALGGGGGSAPRKAGVSDDTVYTPSAMRAEAPEADSGRSAAALAPAPDRANVAATLDDEGSAASQNLAEVGEGPARLAAPRAGGADDLKKIKGVGPKLEKLCNDMGFYHFEQIAAWTPAEVAWVDENLEGFKGRVSRDEWVDQARTLAAGGETEFSGRVEEGDVY